MLFRNNGNGTFVDVTTERGFDIANTSGITASDLNNDRAIDLVLTGERTSVLINPREGAFKRLDRVHACPPVETRGVVVVDFDKDGWMDLVFTHAGPPGLSLWRNMSGKAFEQVDASAPRRLRAGSAWRPFDYDNDGWLDVAAVGTSAQGTGVLQMLRNVQGRFEDVSATVGAATATLHEPRALLAGDLDDDFDADLVVTDAAGPALLLRNDGGNTNKAVRLALSGLNDNRSAFGTKVEVQAGAVWQKLETVSASGFLGQGSPEILVGIGKAAAGRRRSSAVADRRRAGRSGARGGTRHAITQIDRRGSSCPILFSWNGTEYEFMSDSIGPAVIGHWVAPGEYAAPDIDEYVKVDGATGAREGRPSVVSVRRADGGDQLSGPGASVRDRSPARHGGLSERVLRLQAAVAGGAHHRDPWRAPADRCVGRPGPRRDARAAARDRRFVDAFESDAFKGFAKLHAPGAGSRRRASRIARAAADARLHRLLHRDVDVRGASGTRVGDRAVRRGAAPDGRGSASPTTSASRPGCSAR